MGDWKTLTSTSVAATTDAHFPGPYIECVDTDTSAKSLFLLGYVRLSSTRIGRLHEFKLRRLFVLH